MENVPQSKWVLERLVIGGAIRLHGGVSTIGRNPSCTITVASNYVSRNHAEFHVFPDKDYIQVKDLGSTNGIFVNGVQTNCSLSKLQVGDRIGIGVSVENEHITDNHQIFILKEIPVEGNNLPELQIDEDTVDLDVILPSPEVANNVKQNTSAHVIISDSDDDDNEDDFVQPEDIDDHELANDSLNPAVSPFKVVDASNKNVVSENIKSIFGDLNPEMLKNLPKDICEIAAPKTVQKTIESEDVVCISSDDELNDDRGKGDKSLELFGDLFNDDVIDNDVPETRITLKRRQQIDATKETSEKQIVSDLHKRTMESSDSSKSTNHSNASKLSNFPELPSKATIKLEPGSSKSAETSTPSEISESATTSNLSNHFGSSNFPDPFSVKVEADSSKAKASWKPSEAPKSTDQSNTSTLSKSAELDNFPELPTALKTTIKLEPLESLNEVKSSDLPKPPMTYDDGVDEEEELIFTQKMLDEAREELSDSDNEDSPNFNDQGDFILPLVTHDQNTSKKNDVICLDDDDDDEEFDEALESKVNMWTLKLSQSFSNSFNCSQIYEDDVDSSFKIKTEKIFIDDENDEDDASGNDVDHVSKENDEAEDQPGNKEATITESPLIREWIKSSRRNFLFSSSSSEDEDEQDKEVLSTEAVKPHSSDIKRKSNLTDEIPKKKTCYSTIDQENRNNIPKVDKSTKKKTSNENASSNHAAETIFEKLKHSDTQKKHDMLENKTTDKQKSKPVKLVRTLSVPDRRNSTNYKSAKFARSVSTGNSSFVEDFDNVFEDSENSREKHENVAEPVVEPRNETEQRQKQKQESSTSTNRRPPMIITPPQLPVHKGKLRGVSAVQKKSIDVIKDIQNQKDLKRKFLEKPSIAKRKAEAMAKDAKEDRKQRLKDIAKRKSSEGENQENGHKRNEHKIKDKPKVKVTSVNRGAFLAESTAKPYKIPKKASKPLPPSTSLNESTKTLNATVSKPPPAPSTSTKPLSTTENKVVKENVTQFSLELSKVDTVILQKPSTSTAFRERQKSIDVPHEQKQRAPARRNSKKLTFEAMEKHFEQTTRTKEMQSKIGKNKPSNLKSPSESSKKKKTVRFNDVPQIRYIDSVPLATRKADKKESTTFNERKNFIRRRFPIVDHTNDLLNDVLTWSQDWIQNKEKCTNPVQSDEVIYPMSDQFNSIEHYKSVIFPLLKMEYFAHLERHMQKYGSQQGFRISIDQFSQYRSREVIFARCSTRIPHTQLGNTDLALIDVIVNSARIQCLTYISNIRRNDKFSIITMEVLSNVIPKDKWKNASQITVKRVIEGIRVHFGSFNAVHQLSHTPLFQKILNPLELLNAKNNWHPEIQYKGCDAMNPEQTEILLKTYAKAIDEFNPNVTLIKGPPGTGKSRLITNLTLQLLYGNETRALDKKVLICAQSNMAVDVIALQLYKIQKKLSPRAQKYQVIRFGKEDRINKDLSDITLTKLIHRDHLSRLQRQNESNQADIMSENLSQEIHKLEDKIAMLERENLRDVRQDELIELRRTLSLKKSIHNQTLRVEDEKKLYPQYLENANIVCTTLSSCVKLSHYINYFDVCIIDEATQCIEPWTIMPLRFGVNSLIMVGDIQQLPATVLSQKAKDYGLGTSLFTRIQKCLESINTDQPSPIFTLHTQYRMHPEICKWPNMYFYKNELLNSPTTAVFKSKMKPFSILNLDYRQNDECHSGQISNSLEARFVAKLVKALDAYIPNKFFSYGIITPYAQHREKLESMIRSDGLMDIMVNTIDSYQGIEKDVIIISNARTQGVGFLSNYQRLNVALTRPKKCLILCGNFKNLEAVPSWASLLKNARERGLLHDVSTDDALNIDSVIEKIQIKR